MVGSVLHGLQTGVGPIAIALQEKSCFLLWSDSGSLSPHLSQCHGVAIRADVLAGSQKFLWQKTVHIFLLIEGWILNFFFSIGNSHVTTPWTAILTPVHSGDTTSHHW